MNASHETSLHILANGLLATRQRTGDKSLGHRVQQGRVQLVRVTYQGRKSTVEPLSEWNDPATHLELLRSYPAKEEAPAMFIGWQPTGGSGDFPFMALFNLKRDVPGHCKGSTVGARTLLKLGFGLDSHFTKGLA